MNYIGDQEQQKAKSIQILDYLLKNSSHVIEDTGLLNVTLEFVAKVMNNLGLNEFKKALQSYDFQQFLTQVIEVSHTKHMQSLTYIYLLTLVRKTIASELITHKQQLINQVIDIAKEHALGFSLKIQKIQETLDREIRGDAAVVTHSKKEESKVADTTSDLDNSEVFDQIEEFEYEMLQELAETLLVFPSYISPNINENDLYILIGSGVESL